MCGLLLCTTSFFSIRNFFSPSAENFLTFSRLQYQTFLKTFLAEVFELHCKLEMMINLCKEQKLIIINKFF